MKTIQRSIVFAVMRGVLTGMLLSCGSASAAAAEAAAPQSDPLELLFRQGMDALEEDRLRTAIEAFYRILDTRPGLHRARLELAVAYYRALNYQAARMQAEQVLADPQVPPEVRVTVLAFLAQVEADEKALAQPHTWRGKASIGAMYDSNVNIGPDSEILDLGGQLVRLVEGSALEDTATVISGSLSHRYNPGRRFDFGEQVGSFLWQSELAGYHREYGSEKDYNLSVLTGVTGPAWVVLRHWRAAVNVQLDYIWLGGDPYAQYTSVSPVVTWQFTDGELTWDAVASDRRYDQAQYQGRDGALLSTGLALGRYFKQRQIAVQLGARYSDFEAVDDWWGYSGPEFYLGATLRAWPNGYLYGRASLSQRSYRQPPPFFSEARDEPEYRLVAGFNYDFRGGSLDKWSLSGRVAWTDNQSNIALYAYDRTQFELNLTRNF